VSRELAVSRILRAAMLCAARRFQAPEGSRLREALDQLARRLDEWANAKKPEAG